MDLYATELIASIMAGKGNGKGKAKVQCCASDGDAVKKQFECFCGKTFENPKAAIKHSGFHKKKWICEEDNCARVVNSTKLGHKCMKVASVVDGGSSKRDDDVAKGKLRKEISRY